MSRWPTRAQSIVGGSQDGVELMEGGATWKLEPDQTEVMQGDGEFQVKFDGPRAPATPMDTGAEAESRERAAKVEPGG